MGLQTIQKAAYTAQQVGLLLNLSAGQRLLRVFTRAPFNPDGTARRALRRRFRELLKEDLANVDRGYYPKSLLFQLPVAEYLGRAPRLAADLPWTVRRMRTGAYRDLPDEARDEKYPAYYQRNFHWQTDGYFSRKSADLYDPGIEFLFMGMADVMRRQVIPPIVRFAREQGGPTRVLDVGCGTGRTLRQLSTANPDLVCTGLDLSPYYLESARELLQGVPHMSLVEGNAEAMPFADASFDVVTSSYLFHELPRNARRNVFREMHRVLRPRGILVAEDSAQLADSAELGEYLNHFSKDFHEPFHRDFIEDELGGALSEEGFLVESDAPHFVAKVVVARKEQPRGDNNL